MYKGKLLITTLLNEMWTDISFTPSKSDIKLYVSLSYPYSDTKSNANNRFITSAQQRNKDNLIVNNVLLSTIVYTNIIKIIVDPCSKSISIDVKLSSPNILGYYLLKFEELSNLDYKVLISQLMDTNKYTLNANIILFEYRTKEQEDKNELAINGRVNQSMSFS